MSIFKKKSLKAVTLSVALTGLIVGGTSLVLPMFFGQEKQNQVEIADIAKKTITIVRGKRGYGSGVVIKSDKEGSFILTNKHVCKINEVPLIDRTIREARGGMVLNEFRLFNIFHSYSGKSGFGQVIQVSSNSDLCLVYVDIPDLDSVDVSDDTPKLGQKLFNISNPQGVINYVTSGYAGDFKYIWNMRFRQVSIPIAGGSSGSGVFNNDGELVGLVSLGARSTAHLAFMVPLKSIQIFLQNSNI